MQAATSGQQNISRHVSQVGSPVSGLEQGEPLELLELEELELEELELEELELEELELEELELEELEELAPPPAPPSPPLLDDDAALLDDDAALLDDELALDVLDAAEEELLSLPS